MVSAVFLCLKDSGELFQEHWDRIHGARSVGFVPHGVSSGQDFSTFCWPGGHYQHAILLVDISSVHFGDSVIHIVIPNVR